MKRNRDISAEAFPVHAMGGVFRKAFNDAEQSTRALKNGVKLGRLAVC